MARRLKTPEKLRNLQRKLYLKATRSRTSGSRAAFGKTRVADRPKKLTRPIRQQGGIASPHPAVEDRPREEWIEIPVPAIVDETTFALAAEQLARDVLQLIEEIYTVIDASLEVSR